MVLPSGRNAELKRVGIHGKTVGSEVSDCQQVDCCGGGGAGRTGNCHRGLALALQLWLKETTMISHGLQKKALSACQAWRLLSSIVVHGFCASAFEL